MESKTLIDRLYKSATAIYLEVDQKVADDISYILEEAARTIEELEEYAYLLQNGMGDDEARSTVWGNEF